MRKPLPLRLILSATPDSQKPPRLLRQLTFHDHELVMANGIYRVIHAQHRLPTEVTLIQGHMFPGCSKCKTSVRFEFLRPVKPAPDFQINLFTLPELPDHDQGESQEAA